MMEEDQIDLSPKDKEHKSEVVNEDPVLRIPQKIISPSKIPIFIRRNLYLEHRKMKAPKHGQLVKRTL